MAAEGSSSKPFVQRRSESDEAGGTRERQLEVGSAWSPGVENREDEEGRSQGALPRKRPAKPAGENQ